jgi:hypothetical protein
MTRPHRLTPLLIPAVLLGAGFQPGCSAVGPSAVATGRMAYAEAITKTGEEQLLQSIVRDRYERRMVPLAVSGVTASFRFSTNAGVNVGIGPNSAFDGNLVPLSGGISYEENPIISYVPIDTPAFVQQLLSPVPLDMAVLVLRSMTDRKLTGLMLLERLNGLKNPGNDAYQEGDHPFVKAVKILMDLIQNDLAEFVALDQKQYGLLLQVEEIRDLDKEDELIEFMRLLELNDLLSEFTWYGAVPSGRISGKEDAESESKPAEDAPKSDSDDQEGGLATAEEGAVERSERDVLVIAIRFSAISDGSSLAITTRSVYDIMKIASDSVDVPIEDAERGMTRGTSNTENRSALIHVKRSKTRPSEAMVATEFEGWWYYIERTDARSKQYFRTLAVLWGAQKASASQGTFAPLLTLPVSGG